ncbi:MAG: DUF4493 domain-containing protein [Bacteroidales bacterium]|nr:DUF4493 domain-containing protein [Bacteroidales bacterium]
MTIFILSCQKDEVKIIKKTGRLHIDIGLFISVNEMNSLLKSTQAVEDFRVTIYTSDGLEAMAFESASVMPDNIELETGDYYVEAHSDNNLPAAFENPYYYGVSNVFTISSNMQQTVLVNCELANTIVSVVYSANIMSSFADYTTTVSSALDSLVFSNSETRMGYFQTLPLDIMVELTYLKPDGSEASKSLSGSIPNPLANRHYEIFVDALIDEGMATFQILLDETEVQVEVIEITDDSNNQPSGAVGYGEILITEIMNNPSALSDTEGEWFEIYNNSDHVVNLQNLVLGRDDANRHIITDPIELSPAAYFVFTRNELATDATNVYIYGSDILLPNTGAVLSIYNEGTETNPGALIFSVNYGGDNFPDNSGASISLNPDMINAADAIIGTSWCTSTSVYNTGDFGTPGVVNDFCQ